MPRISVGTIELAFEQRNPRGDDAVVFVHGYLGSNRYWRPTLERLPAHIRGVALDLRGTGQSDQPAEGHSIPQYAADVFALTQALGLGRFTLCGHSLGGAVAVELALEHQDVLEALILLSPGVTDALEVTHEMRAGVAAVRQSEAVLGPVLRSGFVRPISDELFAEFMADARRATDGHAIDAIESMWAQGALQCLQAIRVPALVVGGDRDPFVPLANLIAVSVAIPGCGLQVFHRVGHSANVEVAERFVEVIVDFLAEVKARQAGGG